MGNLQVKSECSTVLHATTCNDLLLMLPAIFLLQCCAFGQGLVYCTTVGGMSPSGVADFVEVLLVRHVHTITILI